MPIVFALITAFAYGTGDFLGGLASRRTPPLAVAFLAQVVGSGALLLAALLMGVGPDKTAVAWGTAAGVLTSAAFVLYLQGLAHGQMGVVSTLAAVWTALVPFGVGLMQGERPGGLALLGAATVLLGGLLVSSGRGRLVGVSREGRYIGPGERRRRGWEHLMRPGVAEGTLAGVAYGTGFVLLQQAGSGDAVWPVLAATWVSALLTGGLAWMVRVSVLPAVRSWPMAAAMGLLHALATVSFVLAVHAGLLSIVSVVASMGPIPTTLLAWLILKEKLLPAQSWGVVLGLLGIALLMAA